MNTNIVKISSLSVCVVMIAAAFAVAVPMNVSAIPPVADVNGPYTGDEGDPIQCYGSASPGPILKWEWDFSDGFGSKVQNPSHAYGDNGFFTVRLRARNKDGWGQWATTTVTINNEAPTVDANGPYKGDVGEPITFIAHGTDPGSDDLTFTWDWGDATTDTHIYYNDGTGPDTYPSPGVNPMDVTDIITHTYSEPGEYTLALTVEDDDSGVGIDITTVTVGTVFKATFEDEVGNPYPFDMIISDGTWREEFKDVTYIETEVPTTATYTYVYNYKDYEMYSCVDMFFYPGETAILKFYAVDPEQIITSIGPTLMMEQEGTNPEFSWGWDNNTLNWSVSKQPGYISYEVPIDQIPPAPHYRVIQSLISTLGGQEIDRCITNVAHMSIGPAKCTYLGHHTFLGDPFTLVDNLAAKYRKIETDWGTIDIGPPLFNDAIVVYPPDTTLQPLDGTQEDIARFFDPEWGAKEGHYLLTLTGFPEGYVDSVDLPVNVMAGKRTAFNSYPPTKASLESFTSFVIAESPFSHSSFSNLIHDEQHRMLMVNVGTETAYDWWECFVLPDTQTVKALTAYSDTESIELYENYDYTINHADDYNLIIVRNDWETKRLELVYTLKATVDIGPNTLNLKSKGKWLTCIIELPEDYGVADINPNTVCLEGTILAGNPVITGHSLNVKFDSADVEDVLSPGHATLAVSGELYDGTPFMGWDTIQVIKPGK